MRLGLAATFVALMLSAVVLGTLRAARSSLESIGLSVDQSVVTTIGPDAVASHIGTLPRQAGTADVAGSMSDEGHWRFVNRAGETFTAAGAEELRRAISILTPDVAAGRSTLRLHLAPRSVFGRAEALGKLPESWLVFVVIDGRDYRVVRPESTDISLRLVLNRSLDLQAPDEALAREALGLLEQPVTRAEVRMVALEPGGATGLVRSPAVEPGARHARPDVIDPAHLGAALGAVAGQIVLVSGRLDEDRLIYKPGAGPRGQVSIGMIESAARQSDANLVILDASSARQPGTRNWLWQRIALGSVDKALAGASFGAFLHALAGEPEAAVVKVARSVGDRVELTLAPSAAASPASVSRLTQVVAGTWSSVVSETAGLVSVRAVRASLLSVARQREIDRRIVPGVPFVLQAGYLLLMAVGLAAWPIVNDWWRRIWPVEAAAEYGHRGGYLLARFTRAVALTLLFLPLAALPGVVVRLARAARMA